MSQWPAEARQSSSPDSCLTSLSLNPHYKMTLCQVLSSGKQRQISQGVAGLGHTSVDCIGSGQMCFCLVAIGRSYLIQGCPAFRSRSWDRHPWVFGGRLPRLKPSTEGLGSSLGAPFKSDSNGAPFWNHWACVSFDPAPSPTLKRPCAIFVRLVGSMTNIRCRWAYMLAAPDFLTGSSVIRARWSFKVINRFEA